MAAGSAPGGGATCAVITTEPAFKVTVTSDGLTPLPAACATVSLTIVTASWYNVGLAFNAVKLICWIVRMNSILAVATGRAAGAGGGACGCGHGCGVHWTGGTTIGGATGAADGGADPGTKGPRRPFASRATASSTSGERIGPSVAETLARMAIAALRASKGDGGTGSGGCPAFSLQGAFAAANGGGAMPAAAAAAAAAPVAWLKGLIGCQAEGDGAAPGIPGASGIPGSCGTPGGSTPCGGALATAPGCCDAAPG
mmetsp:Transcript_2896/g.4564  ORF Transcript_2896/g.4564 Transcript_2896/m.4564 type:complete len:256 (-) Transcript_2896:765-1532(-)